MKKIKNYLNPNEKGFTLIELIIALSIFSMIILIFYNILSISISSGEKMEKENEYIQNGKHVINYIAKEIRSADEVISSNKFKYLNQKYPVNLGFVIKREVDNNKYLYITYYHYFDKIRRIAVVSKEEYPNGYLFSGHNNIAEYIYNIEGTVVNLEKKIITLEFLIGEEENRNIHLKTILYLSCPVDY